VRRGACGVNIAREHSATSFPSTERVRAPALIRHVPHGHCLSRKKGETSDGSNVYISTVRAWCSATTILTVSGSTQTPARRRRGDIELRASPLLVRSRYRWRIAGQRRPPSPLSQHRGVDRSSCVVFRRPSTTPSTSTPATSPKDVVALGQPIQTRHRVMPGGGRTAFPAHGLRCAAQWQRDHRDRVEAHPSRTPRPTHPLSPTPNSTATRTPRPARMPDAGSGRRPRTAAQAHDIVPLRPIPVSGHRS